MLYTFAYYVALLFCVTHVTYSYKYFYEEIIFIHKYCFLQAIIFKV